MFTRIMLPLARPAALVVFLFPFIWYWNMYHEPSMFLNHGFAPLSFRLNSRESVLLGPEMMALKISVQNPITEGTKMAEASMINTPPLIVHVLAQHWFVESIDHTGLVE